MLGQHCSMLSTILFGIVTPDCGLIQAQQYCSMLLTTRNNVAPTTLLHPVFNNLLQLIIFCRVYSGRRRIYNSKWQSSKFDACKEDLIFFTNFCCVVEDVDRWEFFSCYEHFYGIFSNKYKIDMSRVGDF